MKSVQLLIITILLLAFPFSIFSQITDTGNNVGIGATSPKEKLHINGNLYMNAGEGFKVFGDANYFGTYNDGIILQMEDGNSTNGNTDGGFVFRGYTPLDNISRNWMVIKHPGNVGIGTNDPGPYKLAVNGNIRATEIKVETGWSDFVFFNDYKLPTLEEVETHIKEKGHLKDIPSAKEVEKNGIFLGEMDSKLLQKIEELTLYTIEQEKQLKTQNTDIQLLKKENESLEIINLKLIELQKRLEKLELK